MNLSPSEIAFYDCMGSYYYSIFSLCEKRKNHRNDILLIMTDIQLKYNENVQTDIDYLNDNPWFFQPIGLFNQDGTVFRITTEGFFDFFNNEFSITVKKGDYHKNLITLIDKNLKNDKITIFHMDQFFIPDSPYYQKSHQYHFLLASCVDRKNKNLVVINSEYSQKKYLAFKNIEQSMESKYFETKTVFVFDVSNFKNELNNYEYFTRFINIYLKNDFYQGFINDIKSKSNASVTEWKYYAKGYFYNLNFKIIPYYTMVQHILEFNLSSNDEEINIIKEIIVKLKILMNLFLKRNLNGIDNSYVTIDLIKYVDNLESDLSKKIIKRKEEHYV